MYFPSKDFELNLSKMPKDASEVPIEQIEELPNVEEHSMHDANDE